MKKLFLFLALIAYTFSISCEECDADCRANSIGEHLRTCLSNCILTCE